MAGRPAAATWIVPPNTIMAAPAMALERLGPFQLKLMLEGNIKLIMEWMARRGLLHNTYTCPQCAIPCSLVAQRDAQDGYRWKCRQCHRREGLRINSFFKSKIALGKLMWFLFSWASEMPMHNVEWHLPISRKTSVDWTNFIRDVCATDVGRNPIQLGGFDNNGDPIVVEIDESYFFHRKYHRGRFMNGMWVFAAIERESGLCCMAVVRNRTAATLEPLIRQWCLPGTHIMSDGWRAYNNIGQLNGGVYQHDVVVHQQNFFDPVHPDIHTQNVENLWMRAKRKLRRQFGTTRALFTTYLQEFIWQQRHMGHEQRLSALLVCIRAQYP